MEKINFDDPAMIDNKEPASSQEEVVLKKPRWYQKKILKVVLIIFVIVGLLFAPMVINALALVKSGQQTATGLQETIANLKDQDLPKTLESLNKAKDSLEKTEGIYKRFVPLKVIPGLSNYYQDGEHLIKAGKAGLEAGKILVDAIEPYSDVLGFKGKGSFSGGTAEDRIAKIVETLDKITPKIDEVAAKLKIVEEELSSIKPERYPEEFRGKKIRDQLVKLQTSGKETGETLAEASPLIKVLPQILGSSEPKKYLFIFQNDGELRPTGGFMTAYAVLKFDKAKVNTERSDDIYTLDKKFGKRLEAPRPIKKYLKLVDYWHLRDMNLSPDFKESMDTFYSYYSQLKDELEVQGIIALDTKVLKDLVEVLGTINVPGYGEFKTEIDKRCNIPQIICELEYLVDKPLATTTAGNRKISVLGPMMQEILLKAMGAPKNLWPNLGRVLINELKEKHVLLYFREEPLQKAAESFGAAGRVVDFEADYLLVNDTNFGGAKSNLYLQYAVDQEIKIDDSGEITKVLTLNYTNPEPMDDCNLETQDLCLNGILPNWLRVYVPKGSQLVEALGSEEEVISYEELNKTVFEAFFKIRGGGGKAKMIFTYKLPFKASRPYKLLMQKQPGKALVKNKIIFKDKIEEFDQVSDKEFAFK